MMLFAGGSLCVPWVVLGFCSFGFAMILWDLGILFGLRLGLFFRPVDLRGRRIESLLVFMGDLSMFLVMG